jgi:hypothetical protein
VSVLACAWKGFDRFSNSTIYLGCENSPFPADASYDGGGAVVSAEL